MVTAQPTGSPGDNSKGALKAAARNLDDVSTATADTALSAKVPDRFVKDGGGSDVADFITPHSQKHKFNEDKLSTKNRSQFGEDINVKALTDDTIAAPTNSYSDIDTKITKYSKTYDFNISTPDTPSGEMRVFINNSKSDRSTQFPYVSREKAE